MCRLCSVGELTKTLSLSKSGEVVAAEPAWAVAAESAQAVATGREQVRERVQVSLESRFHFQGQAPLPRRQDRPSRRNPTTLRDRLPA